MGRRDRERRERIVRGLEQPRSPRAATRRCLACLADIPLVACRQHIRECWGIELPESAPIPDKVPPRYWPGSALSGT